MWSKGNQKTLYKGRYVKVGGDRVFQLVGLKKIYSFESWQMAKRLGWAKV